MIVIPPPLAEYAHDARTPATCPRCKPGVIGTGQRIAQLPGGEWVHAWCAALAVPVRRGKDPERAAARTR